MESLSFVTKINFNWNVTSIFLQKSNKVRNVDHFTLLFILKHSQLSLVLSSSLSSNNCQSNLRFHSFLKFYGKKYKLIKWKHIQFSYIDLLVCYRSLLPLYRNTLLSLSLLIFLIFSYILLILCKNEINIIIHHRLSTW